MTYEFNPDGAWLNVEIHPIDPPTRGQKLIDLLGRIAAWIVPTNALLKIVPDDDPRIDKSKIKRTWLPPNWNRP